MLQHILVTGVLLNRRPSNCTLCVPMATCKVHHHLAASGWSKCKRGDMPQQNATSGVTLYHEGFFWRCSFGGNVQEEDLMWTLWFTNQPHLKVCMHSYLFPFPVSHSTHNATAYESAIIYRSFWSIFMLVGVAAAVLAGFFVICAAPFASHCLYKTGGGFFLVSAVGRGGRLRGFPAFRHVSRFPAEPQLRTLLHVCSHRHLLLSAGRPPLPPDWPKRQDPLTWGIKRNVQELASSTQDFCYTP
ncbi:transmembrane protein 182 isoform X2 [Festucalex cinctus]